MVFALAQSFIVFAPDADPNVVPQQFSITVSYQYSGNNVTEENRIDLRPFIGSEGERDPVVEELERIRQVVEKRP